MSWIPLALLAKRALDAYMKREAERSARFRCHICRTNKHATEEHEHPQLSRMRKSELVKCQIAVPFTVAAVIGMPGHLLGVSTPCLVIDWLIAWPVWAWAIAYRFRKEQRKENEKAYVLEQ